jgi:hypothetical protein
VRIQLRVPEYGWTTQKVFHLLNALVCSLRCGSFVFRTQMQQLHPDALRLVLFDLPGAQQQRSGARVRVRLRLSARACAAFHMLCALGSGCHGWRRAHHLHAP